MALKDVLVLPEPQARKSAVERILEALDEDDALYLNSCLVNPAFSHVYIASKLTQAGYPVSDASIARHRAKMPK